MLPATSRSVTLPVLLLVAATFAVACGDKNVITNAVIVPVNSFTQVNLVSDGGSSAPNIDPTLVNPWGLVFDETGSTMWLANNGTGTSTAYDVSGSRVGQTVTIPPAGSGIVTPASTSAGLPTGVIRNVTADFSLGATGPASFIYAGEDGTISAWTPSLGTGAQLVADRSADSAVYKGIAMAVEGTANRLYLTNFKRNGIDVFDGSFTYLRTFTDSTLPAGYAPFGITNMSGNLFVTFAKQKTPDNVVDTAGAGNGYVDVFSPSGALIRRFAANGALNSPWAIVQAPTGFGPFAGAVLVGNFGDGHIVAYDATSGAMLDVLRDPAGDAIVIPGVWSLIFPPTGGTTLYFASGPGDEVHGLVGRLVP